MKKISEKVQDKHPEVTVLLQNVKSKKAALVELKQQIAVMKDEFKSAREALKKQLKSLAKAEKNKAKAKAEAAI